MANDFKLLVDELRYKLTVAFNRINKLELQLQDSMVLVSQLKEKLYLGEKEKKSIMEKELEKRLVIAEGKIAKLEEILLSNWELINYLNHKYGKFIGKDATISLGEIKGMQTQRHIEELNKKLNGK
tara:strand:+ start:26 stop:403 length:378 start_codon:yes stop_codon:yes gene_type:complete